jgi:nucleotide-binding universal stress UspA family protein
MFERILFPTDFSEYAKRTLDCIAGLPGSVEIHLLHVIEGTTKIARGAWVLDSVREEAERQIDEEKMSLQHPRVRIVSRIETITSGSIADAILRIACEEQISTIVMGARGKGLIKGIFLGSVSSKVIKHAQTHVLIMRYRVIEELTGKKFEKFCPRILSKVLCPTDFSVHSDNALRILSGTGPDHIILLHAVSSAETEDEIVFAIQNAQVMLEKKCEMLEARGFSVRSIVSQGNPASVINKVAEAEDVSLIGMSSYGKGWVGEHVLGSTSFEVARTTKRPVIILHTTGTIPGPDESSYKIS